MADLSSSDEKVSRIPVADPTATPESLRSDSTEDRKTFLSSFSPEEDKAIRRKVDNRFLLLIGLMYMIKNVRTLFQLPVHLDVLT